MKNLLVFLFTTVFLTSYTFAGTENSGGGMVEVCSTSAGLQVRLHDLVNWEIQNDSEISRTSRKSDEIETRKAVDETLDGIVARFNLRQTQFGILLADAIRHIRKNRLYLPRGVRMVGAPDFGNGEPIFLHSGCSLEFAAFYDETGRIHFSPDLLEKMSITDLVALDLHEAIYSLFRKYRMEMNSSNTRKLVAETILKSPETAFTLGLKELLDETSRVFFLDPKDLTKEFSLGFSYDEYDNSTLAKTIKTRFGRLSVFCGSYDSDAARIAKTPDSFGEYQSHQELNLKASLRSLEDCSFYHTRLDYVAYTQDRQVNPWEVVANVKYRIQIGNSDFSIDAKSNKIYWLVPLSQ